MTLDVIIAKETEFPAHYTRDIAEQWADGIPLFQLKDPRNPEWKETPLLSADLRPYGYGELFFKDESVNPTGTIKDRAMWEVVKNYGKNARIVLLRTKNGLGKKGIETVQIPRFSVLSSGNVALAAARAFQKYGLPPVKVLLDRETPADVLQSLLPEHADIYLADLRKELTARDIKILTHNVDGIDITSTVSFRPEEVFYDWHFHEVANARPIHVFTPYGSGRVFECYLRWQEKSLSNELEGTRDLRLKAPIRDVIAMNIYGAEPKRHITSKANKLTAHYKPFRIFQDEDINDSRSLGFTGLHTGVYRIDEPRIEEAHQIMNAFCPAEYSGAAGLALYLQFWKRGTVKPGERVVVVNTGKGI